MTAQGSRARAVAMGKARYISIVAARRHRVRYACDIPAVPMLTIMSRWYLSMPASPERSPQLATFCAREYK
jgi:hypothetical protein